MEWRQVLDCTIAVLQEQLALHPTTGLLADFLVYSTAEKRYKPAEGTLPPFLPSLRRCHLLNAQIHAAEGVLSWFLSSSSCCF